MVVNNNLGPYYNKQGTRGAYNVGRTPMVAQRPTAAPMVAPMASAGPVPNAGGRAVIAGTNTPAPLMTSGFFGAPTAAAPIASAPAAGPAMAPMAPRPVMK